jgi:hypothetical protein
MPVITMAMQSTSNLSCNSYEFKKYFIGDTPVFIGYHPCIYE